MPRNFFKHSSQDNYSVFIHPVTNILVPCIVATHYCSSSSNLDLRNPGGEVGTAPPGTGLEAAGPRLEWGQTKPGIARVM